MRIFLAILMILLSFPVLADKAKQKSGIERFVFLEQPRPVAQTPFFDASGGPVTLSRFIGKAVVLNFWATWCAPCIKEMPSLDALQKAGAGKGIEVVAISEDRTGVDVVKPYMKRQEIKNLKIYIDKGNALANALGVKGLPTTLVIDKNGREIGRIEGIAEWDSVEALNVIAQALK